MKKVITPIATKALLDAGFAFMVSFGRTLSTTFIKTYESINGPRDAIIHIHEARGNFTFAGEFQSEGRNVLSVCSAAGFIPCEIENPEKWVAKYIADAERAVKESYAVRLRDTIMEAAQTPGMTLGIGSKDVAILRSVKYPTPPVGGHSE
jgi:hypothetical protein